MERTKQHLPIIQPQQQGIAKMSRKVAKRKRRIIKLTKAKRQQTKRRSKASPKKVKVIRHQRSKMNLLKTTPPLLHHSHHRIKQLNLETRALKDAVNTLCNRTLIHRERN